MLNVKNLAMNVFASVDSLPSVMSMLTWRCGGSHRSHKDNLSVIKTSWCNVCATIPTCCTPIVPGCYIIWTALLRPDRHFSLGLCNIVSKNIIRTEATITNHHLQTSFRRLSSAIIFMSFIFIGTEKNTFIA